MENEIKRLISNLNELSVCGKKNLLIVSDAIVSLESMHANLLAEKDEEAEEDVIHETHMG